MRLLLLVLLLVMMWLLFWGNFSNADYLNYLRRYEYILQTGKFPGSGEFGYNLIMKIASGFRFEYYQFLMFVSFLGLFLITSAVKRYTCKPQLVYALYFIYPFLLDIVQVRHFLAMSIIIFCFRYLEKDGIRNDIKFIFGILVAFSIQYISIIFLPLVIIKRLKIKQLYTIIFIFLVVGIPLAYTNIFQIIASYLVPFQHVEHYFLNRARFGFVIAFSIQSIVFIMVYCSKKFLEKYESKNKLISMIYKTNIYLFILFPLYIINGTFGRAFRMIMIPNYVLFSMVFSKINRKEKVPFLTILLIFVVASFMWYIFIPSRYTVFFPIFEKNLLLQGSP